MVRKGNDVTEGAEGGDGELRIVVSGSGGQDSHRSEGFG